MIKPALQDDAFLADVADASGDEGLFHLWWVGQSGFLLKHGPGYVLFDPYLSDSLTKKYAGSAKPHVRMSERVVAPEHLNFVDVVTSTHAHTDHLDPETLQSLFGNPHPVHGDVRMVLPRALTKLATERCAQTCPVLMPVDVDAPTDVRWFNFHAVPAAHDKIDRDQAGNHLYLGYVTRFGSFGVYHSGDTVVYDGMAEKVRALGPIDVAILPINGKVGNMGGRDAARLAKDIGARLVIPCHYDMFEFNTADPYAEFVPECERIGQPYRVLRLGERLSSTEIP